MNAIGIGDLHLTASNGQGGLASYIKDSDAFVARQVSKVLNYAKLKGIRQIFLYGDICEGTRMSYDATLTMIKILQQQEFEFHILLGNHDLFSEDPELGHSLEIIREFNFPNVHIYEKPTVKKIEGRKVKFLPWPSVDFSNDCLNVGHQDVAGAKHDSGRPISKGSESDATVVMGHIHTRQKIRNTYYSGTLYQTNFGESKKKFFHHIEYDGGWVITDIPFEPEYRLHAVEVKTKKDLLKAPKSPKDLIKLLLLDGCQVTAADYAGYNVVLVKAINSEQELALAKVEDLKEGSQIEISSDEFFAEWLTSKPLEDSLKNEASTYRTQTLKGLSK